MDGMVCYIIYVRIYIWYGRHVMVWYGNGKYIHDNLHHFYISHLGSQVQAPGPPSSPTPSSRNGSRTNGREGHVVPQTVFGGKNPHVVSII